MLDCNVSSITEQDGKLLLIPIFRSARAALSHVTHLDIHDSRERLEGQSELVAFDVVKLRLTSRLKTNSLLEPAGYTRNNSTGTTRYLGKGW